MIVVVVESLALAVLLRLASPFSDTRLQVDLVSTDTALQK